MKPAQTISLERLSTPEQIAGGLLRLVLQRQIAPGERIRESALAAELGVSRNTVREAIRILDRSGLVRHEMHRGAVVRELSADALRDLYRARLAIETGAAVAAPAAAIANALRPALGHLETTLATGDPDAAAEADLAFHNAIVGAAASVRLSEAFAPILNELRLYLAILSATVAEYDDIQRIVLGHERIVEAFEAGDVPRAISELETHIHSDCVRLEGILAEHVAACAGPAA